MLVKGEFNHIVSGRFEKYFGQALVSAYLKEKEIKCCGLFIDNESQKNNNVFPVMRHDKHLHFVYMNQSLDHFYRGELGDWPVDPWLMYQTDSSWHLAKDVYFLRDVYQLMNNHGDKGVRLKMKNTWEYYRKKYSRLLTDLSNNDFNLAILSEGFDWTEPVLRIKEAYKGFSQDIPTVKEITEVLEEAKKISYKAATEKHKEIYGSSKPNSKLFSPCGFGNVIVDIDGRSRLARLLSSISKKRKDFSFMKAYKGGYMICFYYEQSYQEREVNVIAAKAALAILQERLNIIGYVEEKFD